ncbi:Hoc-like head decoration [Pectobacterium bacteriophage PM2]|uniref:Head outer capsid protein n=1 Tax=Pectobacterium bacteriophage PM2 TaxID=1429794 RepID=A0A0A0PZL1_9CAUD|nr:Hoc-like head decoration [Pectobacterium bacteriophage PM2]AHY25164.1 head outer capsid protein [Pectobacterium bacteriophage PM2]
MPPDGTLVTYLWNTGQTTAAINQSINTVGTNVLTCTITWSSSNYPSKSWTVTKNVDIVKKDHVHDGSCNLVIEMTKQSGAIYSSGESKNNQDPVISYKIEAIIPEIPENSIVTYSWNGAAAIEENYIVGTCDPKGMTIVEVEVRVYAENSSYNIEPFFASGQFIIDNTDDSDDPDVCPIIFAYPLPWRSSVYIWCGWWVMDAIQKLTTEGKDWKIATKEDTPYHCHLTLLARLLVDYPEVDVQESRNGRIVHRSALEAGIIYDYVY